MIDVCNLAHLCKATAASTTTTTTTPCNCCCSCCGCCCCDTKELSAQAHFKFVTENVTKIFIYAKSKKKTSWRIQKKLKYTRVFELRWLQNLTHISHKEQTPQPVQSAKNLSTTKVSLSVYTRRI